MGEQESAKEFFSLVGRHVEILASFRTQMQHVFLYAALMCDDSVGKDNENGTINDEFVADRALSIVVPCEVALLCCE